MDRKRRRTPLPLTVERYLRLAAPIYGIHRGEILELLERLPCGEAVDAGAPEVWRRSIAQQALERYAARRRAIARLARRGRL